MNAKRKVVLDRSEVLEQAMSRATEYLESGKHANWSGFRPLFVRKPNPDFGIAFAFATAFSLA